MAIAYSAPRRRQAIRDDPSYRGSVLAGFDRQIREAGWLAIIRHLLD
jgi:hypothetical protein